MLFLIVGCKGGGTKSNPLVPHENLFPGNPNPGLVRVIIELPFELQKNEIKVVAGLNQVDSEKDSFLVHVTPGFSQLVWVIYKEDLIGMALIIDSALVREVKINAESTVSSALFLMPFVVKAEIQYDIETWKIIHSLPRLSEASNQLNEMMNSYGPGYLSKINERKDFRECFSNLLEDILSSDLLRELNGNIVNPKGKIKGLELIDKYWSSDQYNPNDFVIRNYYGRYAKVVFHSSSGTDSRFVTPGKPDAPGENSFTVDYYGQPQQIINAYTMGVGFQNVAPDEYIHLLEVFVMDVACQVAVPAFKVILGQVVFLEDILCECGSQLFLEYLQTHKDVQMQIITLLLANQVPMAIATALFNYCWYLGLNYNYDPINSCLQKAFGDLAASVYGFLLSKAGIPITTIASFLQTIESSASLFSAYINGQAKTTWIVNPNGAPIIPWGDPSTSGEAPLTVHFTSAAYDPEGKYVLYAWQTGTGDVLYGANRDFTYDAPGTYEGKLTVMDGDLVCAQSPLFHITVQKPAYYPTALYVGNNQTTINCIKNAGFHVARIQDAGDNPLYEPWNQGKNNIPLGTDLYDIVVIEDLPNHYNYLDDPVGKFLLQDGGQGAILIGLAPYNLETGREQSEFPPFIEKEYLLTNIDDWFGAYNIGCYGTYTGCVAKLMNSDPFDLGWQTGRIVYTGNDLSRTGMVNLDSLYQNNWDSYKIAKWSNLDNDNDDGFSMRTENGNTGHRIYYQSVVASNNPDAMTLLTAGIKWVGEKIEPPPFNPVIVKTVDTPGSAFDVQVSDGYAYVADDSAGLQIIDTEPLESAHIVKTINTSFGATGIHVLNGYAYMANTLSGLTIINITIPELAYIVKTVDTPITAWGVYASDSYAYVVDWVAGLQVIDIEPPDLAYIVKAVDTPGNAWGVSVSSGYAYVADNSAGLQIIDIEPLDSAHITKTVDTPEPGESWGVTISYGYAYVGDNYNGLQIIDIEPSDSAYIIKTINTPGQSWDVQVSGGFAYVADGYTGLQIIDIDPPNSAYIFETVDTFFAYGIYVSDNYAYVADAESGLRIIKLW